MAKRVFILVMDGMGVGEMPDAGLYGDAGSHTLGHVMRAQNPRVPTLESLGLFNIDGAYPQLRVAEPRAAHMRLAEASPGKDTTTGHWELAGIVLDKPFPLYPDGFPAGWLADFCRKTGRGALGNRAASGTQIIEDLGAEHMRTGGLIVYTSADSVLQIAAHEDIVPVDELYNACQTARDMIDVGRIIARPFEGEPGAFVRTPRRKDFSLPPPEPNLLTEVASAGLECVGVGKIEDVFCHRGLTRSYHTPDMRSSMQKVAQLAAEDFAGLVFANLVDFDSLYGHRNDVPGYARAMEAFDSLLGELLTIIADEDIVFVTGDHGCDPATPSTDHSREYVPLLVYGHGVPAINCGTRQGFADAGATAASLLDIRYRAKGEPIVWK